MTHLLPPAAESQVVPDEHGKPRAKPRLLFFRWTRENLPAFIYSHLEHQVKCLSYSFDVTLIQHEADYGEVCDRYKPDLALFESGIYAGSRRITNTGANANIPKIGFFNGDSYCYSRTVFLSDMERWGIETYFSLCVSMAEYFPAIARNLYIWPNFVDDEIYRDYGSAKAIPILLTGSHASQYPWRNRIREAIADHYPILICPHKGWYGTRATARMVHGEPYARLINASHITPACGTIAREVVRKHFEIPACKSCLLTEKTPALVAAGFVDMENCVFADKDDVLDKLDYLFRNPEELERITQTGHDLVHANHTMRQRDQIFQWFTLRQTLSANQRIVQPNPFGPMMVVRSDAVAPGIPAVGDTIDRRILHDGYHRIRKRDFVQAEISFLRCLNFYFFPEAALGLALCQLHRGQANQALASIENSLRECLVNYATVDPDPVEWSYVIVCLLCKGDVEAAVQRAGQFPQLNHPYLEYCRTVLATLAPGRIGQHEDAKKRIRPSIHMALEQDYDDWLQSLCQMLGACGQNRLIDRIRTGIRSAPNSTADQCKVRAESFQSQDIGSRRIFPLVPIPPQQRVARWAISLGAEGGVARKLVLWAGRQRALHAAGFIPVLRRLRKTDEFYRAVRTLANNVDTSAAVLISGQAPSGYADSLVEGLWKNPALPALLLLSHSGQHTGKAVMRLVGNYPLTFYGSSKQAAEAKRQAGLADFGLIVIDGPLTGDWGELSDLLPARYIAIRDTTSSVNVTLVKRLKTLEDYVIHRENPVHDAGYTIFKLRSLAGPGHGQGHEIGAPEQVTSTLSQYTSD